MLQMGREHIWSSLLLGFATTLAANQLATKSVASSLFAQEGSHGSLSTQRAYNQLSVRVMDPTGASIPHAHIAIVDLASGAIDQKDTDASGRAEFLLPYGAQYKVTLAAGGFRRHIETFKLESDIARAVTLTVADIGSGHPIRSVEIPLERPLLVIEIPQLPLASLSLPALRIRYNHRH